MSGAPAGVSRLLDEVFRHQPEDFGLTLATVVMHGGRIIAEGYGPDTSPTTALLSWSTAKSITHALAGILVGAGRLRVDASAAALGVPEWRGEADPRQTITIDHLLHMSDGLAFTEDYVDAGVSDVIEMLFGAGQHDVAHFAADRPLAHPPGTFWNYSSGTTNIVARVLGTLVADMATFMRESLFQPVGMISAQPTFDDAGTFVGSSYVHATARDFARFGQLYLRDGLVEGERILPEGWVDHARTPAPACPTGEYGAHWWLHPSSPWGTFSADGYEGQYIHVVPDLDTVIVRLGKTDASLRPGVEAWLEEIAAAVADSV